MPRHRAAKAVGTPRLHAGDVHRDLDDLLLVKDHAERVSEDRLEQRMGIGHRFTTLLAPNVGMDRVALDWSWTDDGNLDDEVVEVLWARPGQRLHLGAGLDLEHADGVRGAPHLEYRRILERKLVEVWTFAGRVLDQVERLGDDRQCAQSQHVHLDQAEVFDVVLVELDDAPAFHRGWLDRRDVDQWLAGDEHAPVVDRKVARELDDLTAQLEELLPALGAHVRRRNRPLHGILDVFGEPPVDALCQPVEQLGG